MIDRGERTRRIAVIPGDGIGSEVLNAGIRVLDAATALETQLRLEFESFPWGSAYYEQHRAMLPADALSILSDFDAIYFGAAGWPSLPDHVTLWGSRLAITRGFQQGVNVRPVRLLPGVTSPLARATASELDFVVVRENSEGEYSGAGGRLHHGLATEMAVETSVFTREAIERIARHAFELARRRPARQVTSITKSNAQRYAGVLWDEVVARVAREYDDVEFSSLLVDAATARLVLDPGSLDVLVASNLHADILSDLTAALCGSLGVAPSANYHLDGRYPSMFEPIHGSAPNIAGTGKANPIAAVLSGAMMLDWLGYEHSGSAIRHAVDAVCAAGIATADLGGRADTAEVTEALVQTIRGGAGADSAPAERPDGRPDRAQIPTHPAPALHHRTMFRRSAQGQASNDHVPT